MPLHDYINHPVALDLVHNGATFQVNPNKQIDKKIFDCKHLFLLWLWLSFIGLGCRFDE